MASRNVRTTSSGFAALFAAEPALAVGAPESFEPQPTVAIKQAETRPTHRRRQSMSRISVLGAREVDSPSWVDCGAEFRNIVRTGQDERGARRACLAKRFRCLLARGRQRDLGPHFVAAAFDDDRHLVPPFELARPVVEVLEVADLAFAQLDDDVPPF